MYSYMFLSLTTTEKTRGRGMSPPCGSMLNQNKCQTRLRMVKERLCWKDSVAVVSKTSCRAHRLLWRLSEDKSVARSLHVSSKLSETNNKSDCMKL